MMREEKRKIIADASFLKIKRERRTTFWLLHQTNVSNLYRVSGDRHMQINVSSIACSV